MKNALQRITLTFALIALIPVGFVLYEFTSLNSNERMINEAYRNQLDAILYSVNQHTDDVFSSWANKIDILLLKAQISEDDSLKLSTLVNGLAEMPSVREIYLTDLQSEGLAVVKRDSAGLPIKYDVLLKQLSPRLKRLATYQRGGYRKIDALDTLIADQYTPVFFMTDENVEKYKAALLIVDEQRFIQNLLAPKLQAISQDKFIISTFDRRTGDLIYSTEDIHPGEVVTSSDSSMTNKELWLLPGYYVGISTKDATLTTLVRDRVFTSISIFAVLFLLLVGGIFFLYKNVRREILLSQAKSEFVSNVSHEIRTPLSLISMYAETLEMQRVPEEKKLEYYSIIVKETARLATIVNRILNFSQMDANKKKYDFRELHLQSLVRSVLHTYEQHFVQKGFTLSLDMPDEPVAICGDQPSLTEAFINLLDNAIKYSENIKEVSIRVGVDKGMSFLEVEDKGIGIPKVYQNHIFEQFYRVPSHNIHTTKGTGLGLALVKKTMLAHKGSVSVKSVFEKGSSFRLVFPRIERFKELNKVS